MVEQPVESIFSRSWDLLQRNWIIVVPGIVIGIVMGVLRTLLTPSVTYTTIGGTTVTTGSLGAGLLSGLLLACLGLIAFIANQAYTTGMAGAAWMRGTTDLSDGAAAFQRDAGNVLVTFIGLILLGIVAGVLAIPTLFLSLFVFFVFVLYAFPAAVVGNVPGFGAIAESFRITMARFVPTLVLGILIFVMSIIAGIIGAALHFIPFLGPIVGQILMQIVVAYATLVVVGEYLNLRGSGAIPPPPNPGPGPL
ncbi:MAG TPA: hypothetical protein VFB22_07160 [Candidatus Baltobacteraceae bacterium]|nr:hypothetical protein [Candidatus Baltobacteraceae bacterium]